MGFKSRLTLFFAALLPFILFSVWRMKTTTPYLDDNSYFDKVSVIVNGNGNMTQVSALDMGDGEKGYRNHTVFLPSCADLHECRLIFKKAKYLMLFDKGEEILQLRSNQRMDEIRLNYEYDAQFFDEDGDLKEKGSLLFMRSEGLNSAFIQTESGSLENIHSDKRNTEKGQMVILRPNGGIEYEGNLKAIRGHGNSTWEEEKKSYQVRLDYPKNLFGMHINEKWLLMSNSLDDSNFFNSLVLGMAREANMQPVPDMVYTDLFVNGEYLGLYQIAEKPEIAAGRVDIRSLQLENEAINSVAPGMAEREVLNEDNPGERVGYRLKSLPQDITGGYLIEHDYGKKFKEAYSRFRTSSNEGYVVKSPDYADVREVEYIAGVFEDLEQRAKNGTNLTDIIDLNSFADKYLIEEIVKNSGAGATSSYFYKDSDSNNPLIFAGPVWDYDKALGWMVDRTSTVTSTLNFCTNHASHTMLFFDLYMNHPEFQKLVKERYEKIFRPILSKVLENDTIGRLQDEVAKNKGMDSRRWGKEDENAVLAADSVRTFLKERKDFLDRVWLEDEPICVVTVTGEILWRNPCIGVIRGESLKLMPASRAFKGKENWHWEDDATGEWIDGDTPIDRDITLVPIAD